MQPSPFARRLLPAMELLCSMPRLVCCMATRPPHDAQIQSGGRRVHRPPRLHATLGADPARPRTIVIGDVHGCLVELQELLSACEYDRCTTRVVLVGDLVNKGPHSAACVRFVRESGFLSVRGNHDDAALFAWERREAERLDGGAPTDPSDKYKYTDEFTAADVAYLRALPYTLLLEDAHAIVVHAGLVPGVPLDEQSPEAMYTMRNLVRAVSPQRRGAWRPTASASEGDAWGALWAPDVASLPASHVIFGHDAKRGLQQHPHTTGLDTGVCYGNRLTALLLPEWRLVSVGAKQVYTKPDSKPKAAPGD